MRKRNVLCQGRKGGRDGKEGGRKSGERRETEKEKAKLSIPQAPGKMNALWYPLW